MKLELRDRARLIRELIVAEVMALPGRGPLALRTRFRPPASRSPGPAGRSETPVESASPEPSAGSERGR